MEGRRRERKERRKEGRKEGREGGREGGRKENRKEKELKKEENLTASKPEKRTHYIITYRGTKIKNYH